MTPDDDVDGQNDVGGDDDRGLATLANLVHGDADQDAIERASPRAADDPRYFAFEMDNGGVAIADEDDESMDAWISADDPDSLPDRR